MVGDDNECGRNSGATLQLVDLPAGKAIAGWPAGCRRYS